MFLSRSLPLTILILVLSLSTAVAAPLVDSELERRMQADEEGFLRAIVTFEAAKALPHATKGAHRAEARAAVLNLLKANLAETRARFEELFQNEDVRSLRWLWIVNGAIVEATPSLLDKLSHTEGVTRMSWDAPVTAPRLASSKEAAPDGDEWTYGLRAMRVPEVRTLYGLTGAGVRVGHIDTGADGSHPDLQGKIVAFADLVNYSNEEPTDGGDHGTHTAGTIVGGNASGTQIGVAPGAELLVAKAIGGGGTAKLLEAMEWMADPDGNESTNDAPRLVSCSWHSGYGDQAPFYEALAAWEALAIIPNFSAGNSGPNPKTMTKPKEYPGTMCSAATDSKDTAANFSSRGPAIYMGEELPKPEWAAPGVDVYSARPGGGYKKNSGTSMAAPHAAGLMALLFEANPDLSPAEVREIMQATAVDQGEPGWDPTYGTGRLDALAAVQRVMDGGTLDGIVKAAEDAAPLAAQLTIVERDFHFASNGETGAFRVILPEGSYHLRVEAFGRLPRELAVTIRKGETSHVNVELRAAPSVRVSGRVLDALSHEPLQARVTVLDVPVAPVQTDPQSGAWTMSLPSGSYRFQIESWAYAIATVGPVNVQGPSTVNAELQPLPPVLFVEDDGGKGYGRWWKESLARLEVAHDCWNVKTQGELPAEKLLPYPTVVWETGLVSTDCLTEGEQSSLRRYLAGGGRLLLSGQDIGYKLKGSAFYGEVLRARFLSDKAKTLKAVGQGLDFVLEGGSGASNQKYPDVIAVADGAEGAEGAFTYPGEDGFAAIRWIDGESRGYYFGFGLEGIGSPEGRDALLGHCLTWLEADVASRIRRLAHMKGDERRSYESALAREAPRWSARERSEALEAASTLGDGPRALERRLRMLAR